MHGQCVLGVSDDEDLPDTTLEVADGLAVVFAGCLDNLASLIADLDLQPMPSAGSDLAAVLAALFRTDRERMPRRLRGVFAGAVTDGRTMVCFRDHVGYRPLFHRTDDSGFFAASEAKQVVAGAGIPREPNVESVTRVLFRNADDDTPSALRGVWRLPKSSSIVADGRQTTVTRYWSPESLIETARLGADEVAERFNELFGHAVRRALTGRDVVSLSGGIDSPAIAAYAAPIHFEQYGRPLNALTVVYPRYPSVDESAYVRPLAARLRLTLHEYEQTADMLSGIEHWVRLTDGPHSAAALDQYAEDYRHARQLGFRNVLSGEHAEYVTAMQWYLLDHLITHARWGAMRRQVALRRARGRSWPSIARLILGALAPDQLKELRSRFLANRPSSVPAWIDRRRVAARDPIAPWERWRRLQLAGFIGPGVSLEAEEVCQAVSGVRSRKPWTDVDLWEFFLGLPAEQKFPDLRSKGLVRNVLRGRVPDEILDRQDKTVFDEAALAAIDYATLKRWLIEPALRLDGVDYALLARRLEAGDLSIVEYGWARDLANVHAFLAQW